jgi:hypothetical protein
MLLGSAVVVQLRSPGTLPINPLAKKYGIK